MHNLNVLKAVTKYMSMCHYDRSLVYATALLLISLGNKMLVTFIVISMQWTVSVCLSVNVK